MRALRRVAGLLVALALVATSLLALWGMLAGRRADLPWMPLDLGAPVGSFTGRKLTALGEHPLACHAALDRAGIRYTALPVRKGPMQRGPGACGYADGVRLAIGGPRRIGFFPPGVEIACPVAAALAMWEWDVVQPAARELLGTSVIAVEHLGSYGCRRLYGRSRGAWSEHATADAIDVAAFRLADGRRIGIARDWLDDGPSARFLRRVRDGACDLFATTLSPDYNAAHRDHLHLDQAARGAAGWRTCR